MVNFFKRVWKGVIGFILTFLGWLGIIRRPETSVPETTEPLPEESVKPQPVEEPQENEAPIEPKPKPEPEPEFVPEEPLPTPEESVPEEPSSFELTPINGKGIWIWRLVMAEDGNIVRIIERAKDSGLRWIAIKGGDGSSWWSQLTKTVVHELQNAGLKVLGWVYTYGSNPENEAAVAIHVLDLGCDGLIVDAEREYEGKPMAAENYMKTIRAAHPGAFIAYSSFPLISLHPTFPYIEFGRYCDASMPQCYWKDIGLGPREMVRRTREEWNNWAKDMKNHGFEHSVVPLLPVGQGYRVTGDEISEFMEATSSFAGISLWVWNEMTKETWNAFAGRPRRASISIAAMTSEDKPSIKDAEEKQPLVKESKFNDEPVKEEMATDVIENLEVDEPEDANANVNQGPESLTYVAVEEPSNEKVDASEDIESVDVSEKIEEPENVLEEALIENLVEEELSEEKEETTINSMDEENVMEEQTAGQETELPHMSKNILGETFRTGMDSPDWIELINTPDLDDELERPQPF